MKKKSKNAPKNIFPIESKYTETIEFYCPIRGKVKQEVTVVRYAYRGTPDIKLDVVDIDWDDISDDLD